MGIYKNKYKDGAWKWTSRYIRVRDTDGATGLVSCLTCGKKLPPKNAQARHYISRRHNSLLFDERNIISQCAYCNNPAWGGDDAKRVFREKMIEEMGEEVVKEIEGIMHTPTKLDDITLMAIEKDFKERTEALLDRKGISKWW